MGEDLDYDERAAYEDDYRKLIWEQGGVSDYSNGYFSNRVLGFDRAVSETLAEVARLRAEGNTSGTFWESIYDRVTAGKKSIKTVDYFQSTLARMVSNVYTGNMGGEFVDLLGALVRGQMKDVYNRAYASAGFSDALPDWLQADLDEMQTDQANFDYIYAYYQAIIDARVDGTPLQPLLDRVRAGFHGVIIRGTAAAAAGPSRW